MSPQAVENMQGVEAFEVIVDPIVQGGRKQARERGDTESVEKLSRRARVDISSGVLSVRDGLERQRKSHRNIELEVERAYATSRPKFQHPTNSDNLFVADLLTASTTVFVLNRT